MGRVVELNAEQEAVVLSEDQEVDMKLRDGPEPNPVLLQVVRLNVQNVSKPDLRSYFKPLFAA